MLVSLLVLSSPIDFRLKPTVVARTVFLECPIRKSFVSLKFSIDTSIVGLKPCGKTV